jgi:hypothetical protein
MLALLVWQQGELAAVSVAVLGIALAAVIWLYPPQLTQTFRRWRWFLPGVRSAILVALALSLLKPVTARPKRASERGAVVLLVDQSRSMQISDMGRSPSEKMALAQGLGLTSPKQRASETAVLRTDLQNVQSLLDRVARHRSEAEYARLADRGVEPARRRFEESTALLHAAVSDLAAQGAKVKVVGDLRDKLLELKRMGTAVDDRSLRELRTKLDQIKQAVMLLEAKSDATIYRNDAKIRAACDELDASTRIGLVDRALFTPTVGLVSQLQSGATVMTYGFADRARPITGSASAINEVAGDRSDIVGAVQAVRERMRGQAVQAIVLVSDGRQVGGDAEAVRTLESPGPPVFTVGVAGDQERRDVAVTAIKVPTSAFVGEVATVRVEFRALGCRGQKLEVWLDGPNGRQAQRISVGDSTALAAEFSVLFPSAGAVELAAGVTSVPGEAIDANNRAEVWTKVLDENLPVMVAAGSPTRDYEAVCTALGSAPWVSLQKAVLSGDAEMLPLTPEEILAQEVLILLDVRVWSLSDAQWEAVQTLVSERGGSVIIAVGDDQLLAEYKEHEVVAKLLPFDPAAEVSWRIWPGDQPRYSLVQAAWQGGMPVEAQQPRWPRLPAVLKYLAMPQLKPNAQALLMDRDTGSAAMAQTRVGLGRSYLLGCDETWRWRSSGGTKNEDVFWKALVRRAAEEPYAAHAANLALDVDRIYLQAGEPLRIRAKVLRDDGSPSGARSQEVQIVRNGQIVSTGTMQTTAAIGPGRYETTVYDLAPGEYELRLMTQDDSVEPPRVRVRVVRSSEAELADLSGDQRLLKRISEATGGEYLTLDQLSALPAKLAELRERQTQWVEYPLWDSPYLFLFVLSGLSLEWALRKQAGLA